jgi:methylated-DNA-[protein]-cysteine S-methyltransferase
MGDGANKKNQNSTVLLMKDLSDRIRPRRPITNFQSKVYQIVSEIPKGKVSTYNLIHKQLVSKSIKSSPQAVGQALRRNPFGSKMGQEMRVPCHRVIASNLKIHGFYGKFNSNEKLQLLQDEGIAIVDGKVGRGFVYEF